MKVKRRTERDRIHDDKILHCRVLGLVRNSIACRSGYMIESGDRFDVRCFNGQWKIHGWDDILEKGW